MVAELSTQYGEGLESNTEKLYTIVYNKKICVLYSGSKRSRSSRTKTFSLGYILGKPSRENIGFHADIV